MIVPFNRSHRFGYHTNNLTRKSLCLSYKRMKIAGFISAGGDLARMLISGENRGEYTEE